MHFCITIVFILVLFILSGCQKQQMTEIIFVPMVDDQVIRCDEPVKIGGKTWQLNALSFYISALRQAENDTDMLFVTSPIQQNQQVALLGGVCGTEMNWQVTLTQPLMKNKNFSFDLGVPFNLNHQNPLTALSPLNQSDMFWAWQLGHKFLRLDLNQQQAQDNWSFHLGSIGCDSPSVMRAPKKPCQQANRYRFDIKQFDLNKPIKIHLEQIYQGVNLYPDSSCMGNVNHVPCELLYRNLSNNRIFTQ